MSFGLAQAILEAHGLEAIPPERGQDAVLRQVDQVLLGGEQAPLAAALLERAGVERARVGTVLADPGRGDRAGEARPGADWRRGALARGVLLPRPGHGAVEVLHREWLAAPGRLALCAGPLPACGAVGMLALAADTLAVTAVLAGGELALRAPRVEAVQLTGALPAGVGGADLALVLLARLGECGGIPDVVELGGAGAATLPMAERWSAAWLLAQAGLPALFPCDESTRAELEALGRRRDWRPLEAAAHTGGATRTVALGELEAMVAPVGEPRAGRPVRSSEGTAVERLLVGPAATLEDLACLAERLEGRGVAAGTECTLVAGSRALLDRATAAGLVARLVEAGVRVAEGEPSARVSSGGVGLCFGVPPAWVTQGRGRWLVGGVESVAVAARAGALGPAAPGAATRTGPVEVGEVARVEPWRTDLEPLPAPPRRATRRSRRWRGQVLVALGDSAGSTELLAPGARLEEARGRLRELAGALLGGVEPGFAERARRRGGGWVVAGEDFLGGEAQAAVAVCLAEVGVRGVLARSYAPGAARTLAHAGVIPFVTGGAAPLRGDELEVAGLAERLAPGRPLTGRNLTRGVHVSLGHELSAREIAALQAGGLVVLAARSRVRDGGE